MSNETEPEESSLVGKADEVKICTDRCGEWRVKVSIEHDLYKYITNCRESKPC